MSKSNQTKLTRKQRKMRIYQIIFIGVSLIVLLSMVLSMVAR